MSQSCYIIAEMSANHGGSFDRAMAILRAAKEAGADAIKLQTYTADTMTINGRQEHFMLPKDSLWAGKTLYELYGQAMTPWEWHKPLQAEAKRLGLDFFSSPFDESAVDFLETLDVPLYKVASFEITDEPLLRRIAKTGKPIIMSTGLSSREEIAKALSVLIAAESGPVSLLKCTSAYPATLEGMNLNALKELSYLFKTPVGLSDHSPGSVAAIAAVALGAVIIEKHLRLDDGIETPDSAFSLTPAQFKTLVDDVRNTTRALGSSHIGRSSQEAGNARFRRSIFISKDIKSGEALSKENIKVVRPGVGLPPSDFEQVLGKTISSNVKAGDPLLASMVQPPLRQHIPFGLRHATKDDVRFLFDLRNDESVRQRSVNTALIPFETHVAWVMDRLQDENSTLMIITDEHSKSIGQIRFDITDECVHVSIALHASMRGKGLGTAVLRKACLDYMGTNASVESLEALIKIDNPGSMAAFLGAGFLLKDTVIRKGEHYFIFGLNKSGH